MLRRYCQRTNIETGEAAVQASRLSDAFPVQGHRLTELTDPRCLRIPPVGRD